MARNQSSSYGQSLQDQWAKMFKRLQTYQKKHNGSCDVPYKYRPDPQLANWVNWQRTQHKKGLLAKDRCDQLREIGFEWTSTNYEDQWIKMLKRLQAYKRKNNGMCHVPKIYRPDPQLGRWVGTQRRCYRKGLLAKERCDQLEAIGFEWTGNRTRGQQSLQDQWTKMFKRLQVYQQEHNGSCHVPKQYQQDPQLGTWVSNQRRNYKKGSLSKDRCDQLEKIGFEWTSTLTNLQKTPTPNQYKGENKVAKKTVEDYEKLAAASPPKKGRMNESGATQGSVQCEDLEDAWLIIRRLRGA